MKTPKNIIILTFMGLFSSCFGQKEIKHIFLAGWEVEFNGDEQWQKFLETQIVDEKTANTIWSSIELVFEDDKLMKAYNIEEGFKSEKQLKTNEIGLKYQELKPHQIFNISQVSLSKSYLGGEIPSEFTIPKFEFNAPFQYLGKFSKSDEAFSWLPFDLHIAAPIYLNFDKLFIDFTDPLKPKVINVEKLQVTDNSFNELRPDSQIVFEKVYISTQKSNDFGYDGLGHTGVPNWIQNPDIPTCPKSGRTMRFLCQLSYGGTEVKTKRTNLEPTNDFSKKFFENMNFWGDGDLYIFFDPESKIACLLIQNT